MRFERVDAKAFGPLCDESLEFTPGLLEFLEESSIQPGESGVVTASSPDGTLTIEIDGRHIGVGAFASEHNAVGLCPGERISVNGVGLVGVAGSDHQEPGPRHSPAHGPHGFEQLVVALLPDQAPYCPDNDLVVTDRKLPAHA